ncbi:coniferyl aldehyde dehydrogenase [Sporichthya polymorpha]|uniref:coniferyl aldehyde dehydrogenase n=1 Tax=Sporichthya polymorpha TaxID=35751 RepID=UPI000370AD8D|nr:coniferyl aldehyde dehydrogenase [Sporichthya polymorpha]
MTDVLTPPSAQLTEHQLVPAAPAAAAELKAVLDRQRADFSAAGPPSLLRRRKDLRKLEDLVLRNRVPLAEALREDFGHRSRTETEIAEIVGSAHSLRYARRHVGIWMLPRLRGTSIWFLPGSNRVVAQPKGVIGIVAPWNYPVHLTMAPLAAALAAGNRAMVKMSEFTPNTTALLTRLLGEAFPVEQVYVTGGDADVAREFCSLPLDHLLFTGSTQNGRAVMRAAAENLTPVTLELGGKSPVVVDERYSIEEAAQRIVWGKLFNAGQTCVAPDYVLVPAGTEDRFVRAATAAARSLYPTLTSNEDATAIINSGHYERLRSLIEDARAQGASVTVAEHGDTGQDIGDPATRKLPLHVVTGVSDSMRLAREEIFGPVLPVVGYRKLDEAIGYINDRPRPLAMYLFTHSGRRKRALLQRTTSGGVTVNDTLLHYLQDGLPFGGSGESGMGSYHGREGFKTFSHHKAVFTQRGALGFTGTKLLYPPYGRVASLLLRLMRRI